MSTLAGNVCIAAIGGHPASLAPGFDLPVERISGGYDFVGAIRRLSSSQPDAAVALVYDAHTTVLPPSVEQRIEAFRREVATAGHVWLIAAPAGSDLFNDLGLSAAYDAEQPSFPADPALRPLRSITCDPILVNLALIRSTGLLEGTDATSVNDILESGLRRGLACFYAPHLGAAKRRIAQSERMSSSFGETQIEEHHLERYREGVRRSYCVLPGISVVTRTTGRRQHLLRRLGVSLARTAQPIGASLEWVIAGSEDAIAAVKPVLDDLRLPGSIQPRLVVSPGRSDLSDRVANLAIGFETASRPYVWIVDDDDYVTPEALMNISTAFFMGARVTPMMTSSVMSEVWEYPSDGPPVLTSSRHRKDYLASAWWAVYQGWNPLPICSFIVPTNNAREVMASWRHSADLSEDYFLLLELISNTDLPSVVEVPQPVVGISLRLKEGDSAMALPERSPWLRDIVDQALSFLADAPSPARLQLMARVTAELTESLPRRTEREKLERQVTILETRLAESEAVRRRLAAEIIRRSDTG